MKKLLTLLFALASLPLFAQNNFEPGYFISNDGTTTTCLIKNLAWKNNPTMFDYKDSETSATQTGNIDNVREFSVSAYKFERHTVDIDRSIRDITLMDENKQPQFKSEMLFLKILVEGKATLYQYEDGNLIRYFYSGGDKNATTAQLIFKEYKSGQNIASNNEFRGQLFEAFKSNIPNAADFKDVKYNKETLVKLFLKYNNQQETEAKDYSASQNKASINFKVTVGANISSLSVYFSDNLAGAYNFDKKISYRFGTEVEVLLPFNNKKWSLFADPNYYSYNNTYARKPGDYSYVAGSKWIVKQKGIEIPLGVRHYMYFSGKAKIFINAAYVLSVPFSNSDITLSYLPAPSNINRTSTAEIAKSSNFAFGAGFSYGDISAELRYATNRQLLANFAAWGADYGTIGLILSYSIL